MDANATSILVAHMFDGRVVQINVSNLPHFKTVEDLHVSSNWSEKEAAISSHADENRDGDYLLKNLFPVLAVDSEDEDSSFYRTPKKMKVKHSDGSESVCTHSSVAAKSELASPGRCATMAEVVPACGSSDSAAHALASGATSASSWGVAKPEPSADAAPMKEEPSPHQDASYLASLKASLGDLDATMADDEVPAKAEYDEYEMVPPDMEA